MEAFEPTIALLFTQGCDYERISSYLQGVAAGRYGFSTGSVRRFCSNRGMRIRHNLSDLQLDQVVRFFVGRVGHTYGRRTLQGLLRSYGIQVSQRRIASSLRRLAPVQYQARRQDTYRLLNPVPYRASHYGEKLHLAQNEKLVMYGVTHVIAVDGYSRKIVGFITLPVKNSIAIYDLLFRPLLLRDGLWEQVRVDHGTEFALVVSTQQSLAHLQRNQYSHPHSVLQSTSRQNHRTERMWPEVNQRINYPVKRILTMMESNGEIDMEDEITKYCVSYVTIAVISNAINDFVSAWNYHRIPGNAGGIPLVLARMTNQVTCLNPQQIPSTDVVMQRHQQNGSRLSRRACFGRDPLCGHIELYRLRQRDFSERFPSMGRIFQELIQGNTQLFKDSLQFYILLTRRFSSLL